MFFSKAPQISKLFSSLFSDSNNQPEKAVNLKLRNNHLFPFDSCIFIYSFSPLPKAISYQSIGWLADPIRRSIYKTHQRSFLPFGHFLCSIITTWFYYFHKIKNIINFFFHPQIPKKRPGLSDSVHFCP